MNELTNYLERLMCAKEQKKVYTDMEKKYKPLVTKLLDENGITKQQIEDIKVNYSETTKSVMNEEKLVNLILQMSETNEELKKCLIPCFTINEDILEELIYAGELSTDDLLPAYDSTTTKTLRLTRVK